MCDSFSPSFRESPVPPVFLRQAAIRPKKQHKQLETPAETGTLSGELLLCAESGCTESQTVLVWKLTDSLGAGGFACGNLLVLV